MAHQSAPSVLALALRKDNRECSTSVCQRWCQLHRGISLQYQEQVTGRRSCGATSMRSAQGGPAREEELSSRKIQQCQFIVLVQQSG
ncbi:hypothetical protein AA309_27350 [Microvirga vignae]|uniref:Uncharacterized protein n=1 Tax=Microvirga vignae TaxID=1225564 RepID=A0A0H1R5Q8_9HYPH|nr:hypothetical protein AA309_27350 [Microvirga vignae]